MAMKIWKTVGYGLLSAMVLFFAPQKTSAEDPQYTRAKIGIQIRSGEEARKAGSRERIAPGDLLQVYIMPESKAFVYLVHSDGKTATLLNYCVQKVQGGTLVMPSPTAYYKVDGQSPREHLTIICGSEPVKEMERLASGGTLPHAQWAEIEKALAERGRIDLETSAPDSIPLAGNVRGAVPAADTDAFAKDLPIFSGQRILVKSYAFTLQKH